MTDLTQRRAERAAFEAGWKLRSEWNRVGAKPTDADLSSNCANLYPLPRSPVEVREEPDPAPSLSGNSWRFVDGHVQRLCCGKPCGFDGGWLSEPYCAERLALFTSLLTHPFRCTGCHAPLATESEEHVCP